MLGVVLLAGGVILRRPSLIPWAVLATGGGYLVGREGRSAVDGWAAVVGVLLLLAAELAAWSIEHDTRIRTETPLLIRRVATLAALTVSALFVNFLLLGTSALSTGSGVLVAAAGVCTAVVAVGIVLHVTERHAHRHQHQPLEHEHAHTHDDGHHDHAHFPPPLGPHSHPHDHEAMTHDHEHADDLHHAHRH